MIIVGQENSIKQVQDIYTACLKSTTNCDKQFPSGYLQTIKTLLLYIIGLAATPLEVSKGTSDEEGK